MTAESCVTEFRYEALELLILVECTAAAESVHYNNSALAAAVRAGRSEPEQLDRHRCVTAQTTLRFSSRSELTQVASRSCRTVILGVISPVVSHMVSSRHARGVSDPEAGQGIVIPTSGGNQGNLTRMSSELVHPGAFTSVLSTKWTFPKGRNLQKAVHNLRVTILCGFVTVLVLRGTIGIGTFGSQNQPKGTSDSAQPHDQSSSDPRRVLSATIDELEDPEPNSGADPYTMGPTIMDWNEQRAAWLSQHPMMRKNSRGADRMLLVTGSQPKPCDSAVGDHLLLKSLKNKIDYCRLHDIDIFYNMAHLDAVMAGFWAKLPLLRKLMLAHPEVEWIWWMDSDAFFTDMVFQLPMPKYRHVNMVLHGFDEMIYSQKSWVGLNTGSFLLRNCQWALDLLDAWAPMGPKGNVRVDAGKVLTATLAGRPAFEADDQSALIYLLITQKARWAAKVYLESQYYLHGYWVILVERFEEMMATHTPGSGDHRWPFVTHFVGCKPCGSYGDYAVERCVSQMERAFNFGDNQILEHYGFQHRSLGTHKVRRLRNDSADPLGLHLPLPLRP